MTKVTVAPITSTVKGLSSEVPVGRANGLGHDSAVSIDNVLTTPADLLGRALGFPETMPSDRAARHGRAGAEAVVEARGSVALRQALTGAGWVDDEPWTPMTLNLDTTLDLGRLDDTRLRVVDVGPDAADDWTGVHWSSFKGTPFDEESRSRFIARWTRIMTGPFADRAHSLIAYDTNGTPVAITTTWTAGTGRPGLVEPRGVSREHHGKGYGVAITLGGARALQQHGASSAVVVAENSNPAAAHVQLGWLRHARAGHRPQTALRR